MRFGTLNASGSTQAGKDNMIIENRIRSAIDRVREQSSSIPDIDRLFLSLKNDFSEMGIATDDPEGERACLGLMLMALRMLMPECKAIMETLAKKRNPKIANEATKESRVISLHRTANGTCNRRPFNEQQRRAAELISLYKKTVAPTKEEDRFLIRTGLATRADLIEALACEPDSACLADLKLWLDRLEPYWRNQPKMTFVEAQALWETDLRQLDGESGVIAGSHAPTRVAPQLTGVAAERVEAPKARVGQENKGSAHHAVLVSLGG